MEFLSTAIDTLLDSRWGNVLGFAGLVAAIYMWLYPRSTAKLSCATKDTLLLGYDGELPREIAVTYAGTRIPRLSRTTVAVWNSGHTTLLGTSLVAEDPLRIVVGKNARVLDARVIGHTRGVNKVSVEVDKEGAIPLTFYFLDPKDCAVIEILHTSAESSSSIEGTIQGMPKGPTNKGRANIRAQWRRSNQPIWRKMDYIPNIVAFLGATTAILSLSNLSHGTGGSLVKIDLSLSGLPSSSLIVLLTVATVMATLIGYAKVTGREPRVPCKKLSRIAPTPASSLRTESNLMGKPHIPK